VCPLTKVRKQPEESLSPAGECKPGIFHRNDFVLLTDHIKVWFGRIGDISLLEACRNKTLVHFPDGKLLIGRSLSDCELRLDRSIFFRASRRYIVNLSHVKRLHVEEGGLVFLFKDGRDVTLSRRQGIIFRKTREQFVTRPIGALQIRSASWPSGAAWRRYEDHGDELVRRSVDRYLRISPFGGWLTDCLYQERSHAGIRQPVTSA
jgi:LytTr DNA-binding domain